MIPALQENPYSVADPKMQTQRDKLKKATQDFEAEFIGMMLKQMRKSISSEKPLFGGSSEAKQYQEMMDEKTAESLSKNGGIGLAKTLYHSLEKVLPHGHDVLPEPSPLEKLLNRKSERVTSRVSESEEKSRGKAK